MEKRLDRRLSVAPMMEWTDRHQRAFLRCLTRRTLLHTEMVTAAAVIHGNSERLLGFSEVEHPLSLQLGGAEPDDLARASEIGAGFGFDEINFNVGCPSERVQRGRFGACLMAEPGLVAACYRAMSAASGLAVSVKCRIGLEGRESFADLLAFVDEVAAAGCYDFAVHARIAVLKGLSPRQNREVPPLCYETVARLKAERPGLRIVLNGGIRTLKEARAHLVTFDGAMIGRSAYQEPYVMAGADVLIFGERVAQPTRHEALRAYLSYVAAMLDEGASLHAMTRHVLGLFNGLPGARAFRRHLSENAIRPGASLSVLEDAMALVPERALPASEAA